MEAKVANIESNKVEILDPETILDDALLVLNPLLPPSIFNAFDYQDLMGLLRKTFMLLQSKARKY
jgi:hypothetical protein